MLNEHEINRHQNSPETKPKKREKYMINFVVAIVVVVVLFEYKGSHLKLVKIGKASAIIL